MLPLWLTIPTTPGSGRKVGIQGKSFVFGTAISSPLGPTRTMPPALARRTVSSWSRRPSAPDSANPAEITTPALTPFRTHSETASGTVFAGIVNKTISTSPGIADTDG